ncbi:MAG TPA: hypothetical protein DDW52_22495 [Planctomycetaceae bacterium]|nr:hypothetical protein [Planctomycetaceae bacterium]
MQRVRQFVVHYGIPSSEDQSPSLKARASFESEEGEYFSSWHQTCDSIAERLSGEPDLTAEVFVPGGKCVIARFSTESLAEIEFQTLELDEEDPSSVGKNIWQTVAFDLPDGTRLHENRNTREFQWDLLDGARRESPFMLSSVEQLASRSSLAGYLYSLVQQCRDMVVGPAG